MKEKPYVKVAMYALNIIFAIIIIVPVIYCFNVSMMDLKEIYGGKFWPSHLTIENYTRAFQLAPFFTFIKNSLIVSGVITFAQVVTGALAAYAFAMMEFKGKKVLFYIMLATMMIPSQAIIIANYLTIADWGIRNTYAALILPNAAAAFAVFNMRQAFLTLPKEIHEAAEIDGCTNFKFLYTIGVPLIKPSLGALIIYVFLQSWNYYLWPLLVTDSVNMRTVQIGLGMLQGAEATDFRPVMAMAITAFKNNEVERIILTRPAIEAGEKLGFLPGDLQSKVDPYLRPLYDALYQIMGAESFQRNMEKGLIEVAPLAYMRGRTLDNAYIILDEAQNTTPAQMKMFLTRIGFGSKVVITGDASQKDLAPGTQSGLDVAVKVLSGLDDIGFCNLTSRDVVRHPLVQKIVKAYETYEAKQVYRESKERRLTSAAAGKTTGKTKRRTEAPLRRNEKERRS